MSEQSEAANRFARERAGRAFDPPSHLSVVPPGGGGGGGSGDAGDGGRPEWVRLPGPGRTVSQFARELGAVLCDRGLFRRDLVPVTVHPETGRMDAMNAERFLTFVEDHAITHDIKFKEGEVHNIPKTMPVTVARAVLASDQFVWQLPAVDRVNQVRLPVMRADGRIELLEEGYDAQSRVYTMASGVAIDETMTPAAGVSTIREYLSEFPFGDWKADTPEHREAGIVGQSRSQAVAVAGMLSMFGASLQGLSAKRLNFAFTSNAPGSGKTLLAEMCVTPIYGACQIQAVPQERAELKKILDTEALAAAPYIFLDNIRGNLSDTTLEAFVTASHWTGRLMNSQTKFQTPKLSVLFLTGNNMTLSPDLARRMLICELYLETADIRDHQVKRVMTSTDFERSAFRGDILSALWAIVRGWDEAGRPRGSKSLPTFEEWSRLFGGMVEHAGFGSPLEPIESEHIGDTELSDMVVMLTKLVEDMDIDEVKHGEFEFGQLVEVCAEESCFEWIINAGKIKKQGDDEVFELPAKEKSMLGKLFSGKYGGRRFRLKDGRSVIFGKRGKNRHRRYVLELV